MKPQRTFSMHHAICKSLPQKRTILMTRRNYPLSLSLFLLQMENYCRFVAVNSSLMGENEFRLPESGKIENFSAAFNHARGSWIIVPNCVTELHSFFPRSKFSVKRRIILWRALAYWKSEGIPAFLPATESPRSDSKTIIHERWRTIN